MRAKWMFAAALLAVMLLAAPAYGAGVSVRVGGGVVIQGGPPVIVAPPFNGPYYVSPYYYSPYYYSPYYYSPAIYPQPYHLYTPRFFIRLGPGFHHHGGRRHR